MGLCASLPEAEFPSASGLGQTGSMLTILPDPVTVHFDV